MFETAIVTYPSAWSQEMVSLLKKVRQEKECWKDVKKGSVQPGIWLEVKMWSGKHMFVERVL